MLSTVHSCVSFPRDAVGKNLPATQGVQRSGFDPWVQKIPPEEDIATQSGIPAWEIP